jgi:hypothetical protein
MTPILLMKYRPWHKTVAQFVLHGTPLVALTSKSAASSSLIKTTAVVKKDEMTFIIDSVVQAMNCISDSRTANPPIAATNHAAHNHCIMDGLCHFRALMGHFTNKCPAAETYLAEGKILRNADNKIVLPHTLWHI